MARSFKLRPSTVHERFGDETVILNLDSGSYYSAQGAASTIWALVSEGCSESNILQRINAEFTGEQDEIATATKTFLDQLVAESLVDAELVVGGAVSDAQVGLGTPDKMFSQPELQKYTDMEEMLLLDPIHEVDEHGWPSARRPAD